MRLTNGVGTLGIEPSPPPIMSKISEANKNSHTSPGFKKKNSANPEEALKICIRGQFFMPNKTEKGTRSIFKCTPSKNAFFSKIKL